MSSLQQCGGFISVWYCPLRVPCCLPPPPLSCPLYEHRNPPLYHAVPSAPLSVVVLDIGPSSVRVEWSATTLPTDDGGSPLTTIRLTYKAMENGVWPDAWSSEEVIADVGRRYALVSGLRDRTTYQIRMEVSNEIGMCT